jgi:hypothetical protein
MNMRTPLLTLAAMLLTAGAALAQGAETASDQEAIRTMVVYTESGKVLLQAQDPGLPASLLEMLEAQPPLEHLRIHGESAAPTAPNGGTTGEGLAAVEARFSFPSVEAFTAWNEEEETQVLLQEMGSRSITGSLTYALEVQRLKVPR